MRLPALFYTTVMTAALASSHAAELPTGGNIVAGTGSITQNGSTMTVTQDTDKMVANWDSFSIGQGHSVHFQQPSTDSVALNRVLGSDVSVIQGSLTANGKIFLVNPNGVTFTPEAQVNTGSLVASTQAMKTEDFLSGNYTFEGASSNAVINKGNIAVAKGGTVALIAAKILNEGTIEAEGGDVLMGAGNKVTLDLGGPVKLVVEEGALDTLIEQGGAIRAHGGYVYLTAKAAGTLATSVINHTGITEAQTLATGEKGEIVLMGDMTQGVVNVAGKLDASAPVAGDGGFVETSAAQVNVANDTRVTTKATHGKNGLWLIDPNDYTVAASGGNITGATLSSNLGSGDVQIQTTGAGGNLIVNDAVSWAANTLTLTAHNNIDVNANLTATGTGGLAFEYGQQTTDGAGSSYNVADGVKVLIPSANKFTWKKGSAGSVKNLPFGNSYLRIEGGTNAALNQYGALLQPFYYDDGTSGRSAGWYKLTFSSYPLDFALGTGGNGTNSWNANGEILTTDDDTTHTDIAGARNSLSIDIAKYKEGLGTLTSRLNVNVAETGGTADIINSYTLEAGKSFIKTETTVENKSNSAGLTNVRLWVGTRDDYVATNDSNYKTKGNLTSSGFETITSQNQQAKAIKITEETDGTGAAILFYSTSAGADTVTDECCDFDNVININPRSSDILTPQEDGSYALFLRMNDLAAGQNQSLIWYYGAGQASQIESIITQVGQSAGTIATTPVATPEVPKNNAITAAQATASAASTNTNTTAKPANSPIIQLASRNVSTAPGQGSQRTDISVGSMDVVQLSSADMAKMEGNGGGSSETSGGDTSSAGKVTIGGDLFGPTKVFVVDGGVNVPGQNDSDEQ